jgi:hypothetical protein
MLENAATGGASGKEKAVKDKVNFNGANNAHGATKTGVFAFRLWKASEFRNVSQ